MRTDIKQNRKNAFGLRIGVFFCALIAALGPQLLSPFAYAQEQAQPQATEKKTEEQEPKPGVPTIRGRGWSYTGNEYIEADVHTRSVAVTSGFSGSEIVVFGAVEKNHPSKAKKQNYDIIVVVESYAAPLVIRKKERMAGIWINTDSVRFESIPTFYAIASTRPIKDIADERVLQANNIGFESIADPTKDSIMKSNSSRELGLMKFKDAIVRLKQKDKLYQRQDYGVTFLGASLFRATINLPVNVPVGPLSARVYLFQDGKLLADYSSRVLLQREGFERIVHDFAFQHPLLYGIIVVLLAAVAGTAASALFGRSEH